MRIQPNQFGEGEKRASKDEVVLAPEFGIVLMREPRHRPTHPPFPVPPGHGQHGSSDVERFVEPLGQRGQERAVGAPAEGFDVEDVHVPRGNIRWRDRAWKARLRGLRFAHDT